MLLRWRELHFRNNWIRCNSGICVCAILALGANSDTSCTIWPAHILLLRTTIFLILFSSFFPQYPHAPFTPITIISSSTRSIEFLFDFAVSLFLLFSLFLALFFFSLSLVFNLYRSLAGFFSSCMCHMSVVAFLPFVSLFLRQRTQIVHWLKIIGWSNVAYTFFILFLVPSSSLLCRRIQSGYLILIWLFAIFEFTPSILPHAMHSFCERGKVCGRIFRCCCCSCWPKPGIDFGATLRSALCFAVPSNSYLNCSCAYFKWYACKWMRNLSWKQKPVFGSIEAA